MAHRALRVRLGSVAAMIPMVHPLRTVVTEGTLDGPSPSAGADFFFRNVCPVGF